MDDLFGKYCYIDTPWIAGKKTRYRIIGSGVRSNAWCEVPITGQTEIVCHNSQEDVVFVVLDTLVSDDSRILRFAVKDIEVIKPPADVRPVARGNWIIHDCGEATCPVCKTRQKNIWDYDGWQNFCGNCGADMRGGEAE